MNKKNVTTLIVVLILGISGYVILIKKPILIRNNIQMSNNIIQCGSINQKILYQYNYQPTLSEKEATIKSLTCINQAIVKCYPALLTIIKDNKTFSVSIKGQKGPWCYISIRKFTGEIITCPLPPDYIAKLQNKFAVNSYDSTIITDLIIDINAEANNRNNSGNCTVTK
jgi:hypothetical protein